MDILAKIKELQHPIISTAPEGSSKPEELSSQTTLNSPSDEEVSHPTQPIQQNEETTTEAFHEVTNKDDTQEIATSSQVNTDEQQEEREQKVEFVQDVEVRGEALQVVPSTCAEETVTEKQVGQQKNATDQHETTTDLNKSVTEPSAASLAHPVVKNTDLTHNDEVGFSQAFEKGTARISNISAGHSEMVLEAESIEEVCEDEELMSLPTSISLDDVTTSDPIDEEEEEKMLDEEALTMHSKCYRELDIDAEDLTSPCLEIIEQGTVSILTSGLSFTTNNILSSHVQGHIFKEALTDDKALVHTCKQKWKYKRSLNEVCVNWKRRKKARRMTMDEEDSSFSIPLRPKHFLFQWKPGWDLCNNVDSKATRKVGHCWKKFDGAHPWAPNI